MKKSREKLNKYVFEWKNVDAWTTEKVKQRKAEILEQNEYINGAIEYHKASIKSSQLGLKVQGNHLKRNMEHIKTLDNMKFDKEPQVISTWTADEKQA